MKVLFIGGTGIISSACSRLAVERGIDLFLLNRGETSHRPVPAGARVLRGDIRDPRSAAAALGDLGAFSAQGLPAPALADFRAFAAKQGVVVPADGDAQLNDMLAASVAYARWGSAGEYEMLARRDPAVVEAAKGFARAKELIEWTR